MSEEERLAYIAKHPIVPVENISGAKFNNISREQQERAKRTRELQPKLMDSVDKDELHKRFIAGEKLSDIADDFRYIHICTESFY